MTGRDVWLERLRPWGQEHLVRFWDRLDAVSREALAAQLVAIDFEMLSSCWTKAAGNEDFELLSAQAQPPTAISWDANHPDLRVREARGIGEVALASGEVGVVIVAGGQGTRLGFDRPKGLFPIGPASGRTLFQVLLDQVRARQRRYGRTIPVAVMTSPATDEETREYFRNPGALGLDAESLLIFCQGTMPAVDASTGKVLLETPSSLALSPDGHGGMLEAMRRGGIFERLREFGVRDLFYCQIDNPLADVAAPESIGLHRSADSELTTLVVRKLEPLERVGNVVAIGGRLRIIEYSDLPRSIAELRDELGRPRLWAGNTAMHVMNLGFLESAAQDAASLPFHRALKKVPYIDVDSGDLRVPAEPNAIKFERFIFDLMPQAERPQVIEIQASDQFAPVKNATGSVADTPETSQAAMIAKAHRWLQAAGIEVASEIVLEISPELALDAGELAKVREHLARIERSQFLNRATLGAGRP